MTANFFKNMSYISLGTFFQIFVSLLSAAIYIRVIGTSGYAILGIVFSFMYLVWKFDVPFFLSFLKYNSATPSSRDMHNTLYNSVLISNIIIFTFSIPIVSFLSYNLYKDDSLIPFYLIAMAMLMMLRVSNFLKGMLRANKVEVEIQKAAVTGSTLEFILALSLLLIFGLGVLSIFIASLLAVLAEYLILTSYARNFLKYKPYFSFRLFIKSLKECNFQHYLTGILNNLMLSGGLFISTFYLGTKSLGILSIIFSIVTKLQSLYFQSFSHLSPIYQDQIFNRNHERANEIMGKITLLLLAVCILPILALGSIGETFYLFYFGNEFQDTYSIFLWIIIGSVLSFSFVAVENYFFVYDIKLYNGAKLILVLLFFTLLFPMAKIFGIKGVAISMFITSIVRTALFLISIIGKISIDQKKEVYALLFVISSFAAPLLLYPLNSAFFVYISFVFIFLGIAIFLFRIKSIFKTAKFVIFEI